MGLNLHTIQKWTVNIWYMCHINDGWKVTQYYLRKCIHLLFIPQDLQHAGTYRTTGSWKEIVGHGLLTLCTCHEERPFKIYLTFIAKIL